MGGRGASSASAAQEIYPAPTGMSIEEAMLNTNPKFQSGKEYQWNCQRCVYAYEMNRRGEKCIARPTNMFNGNDDYARKEWSHTMQNQKWYRVGSKSGSKTISNIEDKMRSYGNGARGIIYVVWEKGDAHVFNVENIGGKIHYIDSQSGQKRDILKTISAAKPTKTLISRIDNLAPDMLLLDKAIERI